MSDGISIIRPDIPGQACVKIREGNREVSIACDDSCGALVNYERADIRCYEGPEYETDVTQLVFGLENTASMVHGSVEHLFTALAWLREKPIAAELEFTKQVLKDATSERGLVALTAQLNELRVENARLNVRVAQLKTASFGARYGMGPERLTDIISREDYNPEDRRVTALSRLYGITPPAPDEE